MKIIKKEKESLINYLGIAGNLAWAIGEYVGQKIIEKIDSIFSNMEEEISTFKEENYE